MARKRSALVDFQQEKRAWSLTVRSTDRDLLVLLMNDIKGAEGRGLQILNSTDPFAGARIAPRKPKAKKPAVSAEGKPNV